MIKLLAVVVVVLAACGGNGDKCAKVYDKLAPMMEKEAKGGKSPDRGAMIAECKDKLKAHPEREGEMDCILAISGELTMDKLIACSKSARKADESKGGFKDYQDKSKATEAKLQLDRIGKGAKRVFAETGTFPMGSAPLTPATECCAGPDKKCAPDAKAWTAGPWSALDFAVDEPHRFRYAYEGSADGTTFTATAVGDLDCSGAPITYKLSGSLDAAGNPKVDLQEP
jgi:hypothetical protein